MALLELDSVEAHYQRGARVLRGITLRVETREIVSLFGRNGAGKTSTLRAVMGWLRPSSGGITFDSHSIGGLRSDVICRMGVGFIPEDRRIFQSLTVEENLALGLFSAWRLAREERAARLGRVYDWFPRLAERRWQNGRTLSGGEQQMLAIGRALVGSPRLLLVDEPSEGLAPMIVSEIFEAIERMRDSGMAILLVEQNVRYAAKVSGRCYVMEKGAIFTEGDPRKVLADEQVRQKLAV